MSAVLDVEDAPLLDLGIRQMVIVRVASGPRTATVGRAVVHGRFVEVSLPPSGTILSVVRALLGAATRGDA